VHTVQLLGWKAGKFLENLTAVWEVVRKLTVISLRNNTKLPVKMNCSDKVQS